MIRLALFSLLATLLFADAASAAVKASAALVRSGAEVRLEVTVTSSKAFTAKTRPKSVKVGALALKRASTASKAVVFRSGALSEAAAGKLSGTSASIRVKTSGATKTLRAKVAPAPAATPAPGAPAAPAAPGGTPPPSAPSATRNDAPAQAAMSGDLLLEYTNMGSTGLTAEYRRMWLMADGRFQLNVVDWMYDMGEKCSRVIRGSWAFKEGYTSPEKGGLVLAKISLTTAEGTGDEVLTFANADPNAVYVGGASPVRFERNPQIMQNCG